MDLLTFARGPALQWSLAIFCIGVLWRLLGVLLLRRKKDYTQPRSTHLWRGAIKGMVVRMWPYKEFRPKVVQNYILGYVFHLGLFIVVFFFVPHILFIRNVFGVSWGGLPNSFIYVTGAVTVAALVAVLIKRIANPVTRLLSNFDDYFSWLITLAPVVTGLMAAAHFGARYEHLLAVHILSVELLLVWFPFGKLMHTFFVFVSRGTTGALFERKGTSA